MPLRKPTKKSSKTASRISKARLAAMIEEATVDAYGDSEQTTGWYTMLEEHLALPFETTMLGVLVKVVALDVRGDNSIVTICTRGRERQSVPILDLPLPSPMPVGHEWVGPGGQSISFQMCRELSDAVRQVAQLCHEFLLQLSTSQTTATTSPLKSTAANSQQKACVPVTPSL